MKAGTSSSKARTRLSPCLLYTSFLYIDGTNNGRRVTKEDQERIRTLLTYDDRDIHSEHLGIRNVSQRLTLIYGPSARLTLSPDEHGDTLARIVIPLAKDPKEEKP